MQHVSLHHDEPDSWKYPCIRDPKALLTQGAGIATSRRTSGAALLSILTLGRGGPLVA